MDGLLINFCAGDAAFSKLASFLVIGNVLLAMPLEMFVVSASYDDVMLKYFPKINKQSGKHIIWLLIRFDNTVRSSDAHNFIYFLRFFLIHCTIFHRRLDFYLSLEWLTTFWKMRLKVA